MNAGEVVLGDPRAARVISREQLTDDVLAVVETAIALHLGLTVAMLESGDEAAAQAQVVPWSVKQSTWAAMSLLGAAPEAVEFEADRLVVTVSSPLSVDTLKAVAGAVPNLTPDVHVIEVRGVQGSLSGPVLVLRRFLQETDDDLKQAHFMRVLAK